MNRNAISHPAVSRPRALATAAVVGLTLLPAACATGSQAADDEPTTAGAEASALTVEDAWAKAADDGMTAVFGTITNTSDADVRLVSAETDAAASAELHVFVDDGGTPVMQEADGGIVIPADELFTLEPGGPHLMLLGVTDPLEPGEDVTVVVAAEDGSELTVTAPVRSFDGANESYDPDGDSMSHEDMDHEGTDHDMEGDAADGTDEDGTSHQDGESADHSDHEEDM